MKSIRLSINDTLVEMPEGASVAAAIFSIDATTRRSVCGERRAPLCGMGVCFECRVQINGEAHVRACLTEVRDGMQVHLDG